MTEFDYIIAGAGTAGCVLAARLSQDPGTRVLLLEAGGPARTRAMTVPDAWPELLGTAADWAGITTAQADAGPVPYPRGRALGGSGAINAMAHVRGHRAVYDGWAAGGAAGWGYADLLPYFRRSEHASGATRACAARQARSGSPRSRSRTGIRSRSRSPSPWPRSAARSPMTSAAPGRRACAGPTWPSTAGSGSARLMPT